MLASTSSKRALSAANPVAMVSVVIVLEVGADLFELIAMRVELVGQEAHRAVAVLTALHHVVGF